MLSFFFLDKTSMGSSLKEWVERNGVRVEEAERKAGDLPAGVEEECAQALLEIPGTIQMQRHAVEAACTIVRGVDSRKAKHKTSTNSRAFTSSARGRCPGADESGQAAAGLHEVGAWPW